MQLCDYFSPAPEIKRKITIAVGATHLHCWGQISPLQSLYSRAAMWKEKAALGANLLLYWQVSCWKKAQWKKWAHCCAVSPFTVQQQAEGRSWMTWAKKEAVWIILVQSLMASMIQSSSRKKDCKGLEVKVAEKASFVISHKLSIVILSLPLVLLSG